MPIMANNDNTKSLDNKTKEKTVEKRLCHICQKTLKDHKSNLCYKCYCLIYSKTIKKSEQLIRRKFLFILICFTFIIMIVFDDSLC